MTFVPTSRRGWGVLGLSTVLLAGTALARPAAAASDEGPGWLGLVEGEATIERAGVEKPGEEGRPLLPGDRLTTAPDARIEVVLADDTAVFVAGEAELVFSTLAGVGDEGDLNLLLLERGELLLASEGGTETRVDTHNASVYVGAGSYRIERDGDSTRVVARRGNAELRTRQGVVWVEAQEQGRIEGDGMPAVGRAGEADTLEQWAAELGERRERGDRLAFEDDGELGLGGDDFGFGFWSWDDGGSVCVRGCGGTGTAVRTRPPHPPAPPSSADSDTGEVELAVDKPWPLEDASDAELAEVPVEKPEVDEMPDEASVGGAFLDTNEAESTDSKPVDVEPASLDAEPGISNADTSSPDPAPSVDIAASDSGGGADMSSSDAGSSSVSEPTDSPPSPQVDAPSEPNR